MMEDKRLHTRYLLLFAALAFVAQAALAPSIAVMSVTPDFVIVTVAVVALFCDSVRTTVFGFILGLSYDFLAGGPIGVMALIATVIGFAMSSLNKAAFATGWLIELAVVIVAALFGEFLHAVVLAVIGYDGDFVYSLFFRAAPGMLYDSIIGLVALLVINLAKSRRERERGRLFGSGSGSGSGRKGRLKLR
jgi:rod shape-determining protein MreD